MNKSLVDTNLAERKKVIGLSLHCCCLLSDHGKGPIKNVLPKKLIHTDDPKVVRS